MLESIMRVLYITLAGGAYCRVGRQLQTSGCRRHVPRRHVHCRPLPPPAFLPLLSLSASLRLPAPACHICLINPPPLLPPPLPRCCRTTAMST